MLLLMQCKELRCRAWDESSNVQPANLTWNLMYAQLFRAPSRPCLLCCAERVSLSLASVFVCYSNTKGESADGRCCCVGRGMGNNPHFRVEIHPATLPSGFGLRFVHPTIAGPVKDEKGDLVSGGWMGTPDAPRESRGMMEGRPGHTVLGGIPGAAVADGATAAGPPARTAQGPPVGMPGASPVGMPMPMPLSPSMLSPSVGTPRIAKPNPNARPATPKTPAASPPILRKSSSQELSKKAGMKKSASNVSFGATSTASDTDTAEMVGEAYTMEEIAKHDTEDDCWIVVNGLVYDCTEYLSDHPGGAASITMNAGEDCSEEFTSIHSEKAWKDLEPWRIGWVTESATGTPKKEEASMTYSKSSTKLLNEQYKVQEEAGEEIADAVEDSPVALNPKKWLSFPLTEKIVMSEDTALFRFALPSPQHQSGLPTGWHIFLRYRDATVRNPWPCDSHSDGVC